ncbi:MAG: DegT/DnrJ/EryC1/StrS family aminotransferase [Bryobacteraceae bacterium]|jgi:perosamine synthetase
MSNRQEKIFVAHPAFFGNEKKYVQECLDTMWISSAGRFVSCFEEEFARFCGVEYAIACDTGTSALHLALMGLNVGPGDEVIVPTLTFVATANAVRYCGAEPVFVDSEPRTMNLDPDKIEGAITPQTRGIVAVHLYGHPADLDPILDIAQRHNLFVLEDAAEAHGAKYRGRTVGAIGSAACFSFFGNKIVTTGEGGMVTTRNAAFAEKVRLLRGQGMDPQRRYWFPVVGYNYRMTNIQAAIGLAQMENIEQHLSARVRVSSLYYRYLKPYEQFIELPVEETWAHHAFWMYTVLLKPNVFMDRDLVMEKLAADGIETRPVFYPMHTLPPYCAGTRAFPVAERLSRWGISLPTHALLSEGDVAYIAKRLGAICEEAQQSLRWTATAATEAG